MEDNTNNPVVEAPTALTEDAIGKIIDSRINNFVHSSKTDLAKFKDKVTSFESVIEGLRTASATPLSTEQTPTVVDPKMSVLERQIKELSDKHQAALDKAAKADRENALTKTLAGYQFANDASREIAYKTFASEMTDLGDGSYAIGDQSLSDAIKSKMESLTGLLAPRNVGGSGAKNNAEVPAKLQYRKDMTNEERRQLVAQLSKNI